MYTDEKEVLMQFLLYSPEHSLPVLRRFAEITGSISVFDGGKNNFVYIPGTRKDRVVLVAHTDTVWDDYYVRGISAGIRGDDCLGKEHNPALLFNGTIRQKGSRDWGLGADDRAGCAMLWLLRNSGHSLLLTDGEEYGQIGAHFLMDNCPEIAEELNAHNYMIQLDRRNHNDYKTYALPVSRAFRQYIESRTAYHDAGRNSRTDIVVLCKKICGVNFSIGYYNEHTPEEYLDVRRWLNTYKTVKKLLMYEQPRFPLDTAGTADTSSL